MHLLAVMTLAAAVAEAPDISTAGAPRAARLVAQAPEARLPLPATGLHADLDRRVRDLLHERRMLESQLHSNAASATFYAVGGAACLFGVYWGIYALASVPVLGYFRFSDVGAIIGGGASILGGVLMIILAAILKEGVDRYNAPVRQRLDSVEYELERLKPPEPSEDDPRPPPRPPPAPPPVVSPL